MPKHLIKLVFFLIILIPSLGAAPVKKVLEISGLKMYSQGELRALLNLDRFANNKIQASEVIDSIVSFYGENGFTLAKVYVIENSGKALRLYVDEGTLGKIIFLNIDDFTSIYLRITFALKNNIFNIYTVQEYIDKRKKSQRFRDMKYLLKPVKEFDASLFQLDRELNLPMIGKKQLPFFEKFSPRYDLVIYLSKTARLEKMAEKDLEKGHKEEGEEKEKVKFTLNKFDYGLRVHYYKGFIPYGRYYHLGLLGVNDFLVSEASLGIMYGIDRKFDRLPRFTYFNFNMSYFFPPTFQDVFTPLLRFDLYDSQTARPDLGLLKYNYLTLNGMLAPGFTFLKKISTHVGVGSETAFFYNSRPSSFKQLFGSSRSAVFLFRLQQFDPTQISFPYHTPAKSFQNYKNALKLFNEIEKHTDEYGYVEVGAAYDFSKKGTEVYELRKNRLKKEIAATYDFFFLKKIFNRIRLIGSFDYEFEDKSIYSGMLIYQYLFKNPPFYQEASVSNPAFKGLNSSSYFSRNCLSESNEYRISVYKDFLYIGAFFDMTLFEGSGRDLSGAQFAFSGGPTCRLLLMDTFELYLHYSWDYLLSEKKSKGFFYFNIYNKW